MPWYSAVAVPPRFATGLRSFCGFRFLLGAGEAANWPGATKAVSEWFPRRERGWAVALFDSGSSIGAAVAPALVLFLSAHFGGWRPAFVIIGMLGFLWLMLWRLSYHPPETHPEITEAERAMILADRAAEHAETPHEQGERLPHWSELLRLRQTWGAIAARGLTDPVWFMIADWFAIYLVAKGFNLEQTAAGFWVPFLAADLGNFFGGGFSSWLIRRGWPVGRARRLVIVGGGIGVLALVPAAFASSFPVLHRVLRGGDLLVRCDVHHGPLAARRPLPQPRGRLGRRDVGHGRRPRHDRRDLPDRRRRRPLLVHADPARGERRPAGRRGRRAAARPQHGRVRAGLVKVI